jgi:hypothetical protein
MPAIGARLADLADHTPAHAAVRSDWHAGPVVAALMVGVATAVVVATSWLASQAPAVADIIGH